MSVSRLFCVSIAPVDHEVAVKIRHCGSDVTQIDALLISPHANAEIGAATELFIQFVKRNTVLRRADSDLVSQLEVSFELVPSEIFPTDAKMATIAEFYQKNGYTTYFGIRWRSIGVARICGGQQNNIARVD
jgi:hypothetical protein